MDKNNIAQHLARVTLYQFKGADMLYPEVKVKYLALVKAMQDLGKPVYLAQGLRSAAEQDLTYAKGRTMPGSIVTNARGLQSYHQYGLAFDLIFVNYNWTPPSQDWWNVLGMQGQKLGLEWGGSWNGFKDLPHFEYHPNITWKDLINYFVWKTSS